MGKFLAELKRRHIYRVAATYVVVAWLLLQIVNNVVPLMQSPVWVGQFCLLLLALGFPLAIFFSWTREVPTADANAPKRATLVDFALIAVLVAVLISIAYQEFAPHRTVATAEPSSAEIVRTAAAPPGRLLSVAVLPFANMSGDAGQEFFSDGMTEEITTALAKVPNLRVVGRTSAFQFKGQSQDLRDIGQKLSATHLIEGSVRKVGDRVRITVQLIKADDGTHLWAEDYNRQLTDVFAVQEDIARSITASLRVPLGLKQGESLVSNRDIDPQSYEQYLRAKGLYQARTVGATPQSIAILQQVIARAPNFAPAWAWLARNHVTLASNTAEARSLSLEEARQIAQGSLPEADVAARRAIELDPNLPDGYLALGRTRVARGDLLAAEELYAKALALDSDHPQGLEVEGNLLAMAGQLTQALTMKERLLVLEPFVANTLRNSSIVLWLNGEEDKAIKMVQDLPASEVNRALHLARFYAGQRRYREAADTLQEIPDGSFLPGTIREAERLLRGAPAPVASSEALPKLGRLEFVYLAIGAPTRTLDYFEAAIDGGYSVAIDTSVLWHASYAPVRKTERFKAFARKAGLVEYWRAKGWPKFCQPASGGDFVCA